ncbi:hypothetical protein AB0J42_17275 [Nonomuraea sp. NPDC049649]|uniref:hypothetical protein n=1 Tax=Nonomuraea sp. NPDC049649 TaxID=3155776 RepID=UPI0034492785
MSIAAFIAFRSSSTFRVKSMISSGGRCGVRGSRWCPTPTALAVHDLGIANPAEIHLTVPPGFRRRHPALALHMAELTDDQLEEREGFRVTKPVRAIAETAADGTGQDLIDSAVAELLDRGAATKNQLLRAAQQAGLRAELAVERALRAEHAQVRSMRLG